MAGGRAEVMPLVSGYLFWLKSCFHLKEGWQWWLNQRRKVLLISSSSSSVKLI
jgi:hypothetical protein